MGKKHVPGHGKPRALGPVLWLGAVLAALFVSSLLAIVFLLHQLVRLAVEVASQVWGL